MTRPVFLLSLPRAGSTLLQRLLLMTGRCSTLGEPSLLLRFLGEGPAMSRRATYWESLVETSTADIRKTWPEFDGAYRTGVRDLMQRIYDGLAEGKEFFIDKTPRYSLIAGEILATFPEAKFIVLWRHPLAVAASISSTFRKGRWCPDEFGIDLHEGQRRLQEFCKQHGEAVFQLRYEDLVTEPGKELARLGSFLGIENLADVLEHAGRSHGREAIYEDLSRRTGCVEEGDLELVSPRLGAHLCLGRARRSDEGAGLRIAGGACPRGICGVGRGSA